MKSFPLLGLLLTALLLPWNYCLADQSDAEADFSTGVVAFQRGNTEQARVLLEKARSGGLESPSLFYNLGVVYFRLDRYEDAERAFSELLNTPHAPLAKYNLGLVHQEKGDAEESRKWFLKAADSSSPEQIQALARRQLATSEGESSTANDGSRDTAFVSLAAGFDDNIASTPSGTATDESGAFMDLLASGQGLIFENRGQALRLNALAYTRRYPGNKDFDNTYAKAGAAWLQPLEAARLTSKLSLSGLWFDTDLLERRLRLDLGYQRPGCFWPQLLVLDCQIQAFAATIQGGSGFEAYDGSLYGGALRVEKSAGPWTLEAAYRLDIDRREDLALASEFYSLSPTRNQVSVEVERRVSRVLSVGFSQSLRHSRYDDPHVLQQDGQLQTTTRVDDRYRAQIFAGYLLDAIWRLGIELGWETSQSTIERYEYDRTEVLLSIDGVF